MYENFTNRSSTNNCPKPLAIRLAPIPINEKAAYIDSVCASLIDNRFGRRLSPFLIDVRELPEDRADEFCELPFQDTFEDIWPSSVVVPDSAMARRHAADITRRELARAEAVGVSIRLQTIPASNLGRGSPNLSGTHRVSVARICP